MYAAVCRAAGTTRPSERAPVLNATACVGLPPAGQVDRVIYLLISTYTPHFTIY